MTKREQGAAPRGPGRPALPPEERRRRIDLTISPEALLALDVIATGWDETRSGAVERLIRAQLTRRR